MPKKCFISGGITGKTIEQASKDFLAAEYDVVQLGYEPVNPIRFVPIGLHYDEQMEMCFEKLEDCEAIYLLRDFRNSSGSLQELERSNRLGILIIKQK